MGTARPRASPRLVWLAILSLSAREPLRVIYWEWTARPGLQRLPPPARPNSESRDTHH